MKKIFFCLFLLYSVKLFTQEIKTNAVPVNCDTCVYDLVAIEYPPKFPGGEDSLFKFLLHNITYPAIAKEIGLEGKVFIAFVIDTTGQPVNIEVYKGAKPPTTTKKGKELSEKEIQMYKEASIALNEESVRVVHLLPKYTPGKQNGKLVKVRFIMPFSYRLT